jgi:hypothetical protein
VTTAGAICEDITGAEFIDVGQEHVAEAGEQDRSGKTNRGGAVGSNGDDISENSFAKAHIPSQEDLKGEGVVQELVQGEASPRASPQRF